jgi:hypothetical protein
MYILTKSVFYLKIMVIVLTEGFMKKAILIIVSILFISSFAGAKSSLTGVGIYGNYGNLGSGLGLTLKFGNFPVLGLQWDFAGQGRIGATIDYWVINQGLGGTALSYYLGVGAFGGLAFGDPGYFDIGARLPLGLQLYPVNKLELFLEIAPDLDFLPTLSLGWDLRAGLRVHF